MYYGERLNSATHLAGTLLAIAGTLVLMTVANRAGLAWERFSLGTYGVSLILLYLASTLFHSTPVGRLKARFAVCDHCAIYLLIAGTYTPLSLLTLRGVWGLSVFSAVWVLALLGIARELIGGQSRGSPSVLLYVLMGWCGLVAIRPLCQHLARGGLLWLGVGAVLYTVGTLFYVRDTRWRHGHGIWHLFVLAGSASHYYAILNYVA